MSSIYPSSQQQKIIREVDTALEQSIIKAKNSGVDKVKKDLSSIQHTLTGLLNNPDIPESVQQSLQAAANELKRVQMGAGTLSNLQQAKTQLDAVLSGKSSDEHKLGGGSLGGGSEES
jgi:hypothetical protein